MARTLPGLRRKVTPADQLEEAITAFFRRCQAKNLSVNTTTYYHHRFMALRRYLDAHDGAVAPYDFTPVLIRAFLTDEAIRVSPLTAEHSFITLRVWFRFLVADGLLADNPMTKVERPKVRKKVIETFLQDTLVALIKATTDEFTGLRTRAILYTLADCGLRVSELCGLRLPDIYWKTRTMKVIGKGDKERIVPFGTATERALHAYLGRRGEIPGVNLVFVNVYGQQLTRFRVDHLLKETAAKAGIDGRLVHPHNFRRYFAVSFIRAGGDPFTVQQILGHTDLTMTRRYAELAQSDVVEKHRLFSPGDALPVPSSGPRKQLK